MAVDGDTGREGRFSRKGWASGVRREVNQLVERRRGLYSVLLVKLSDVSAGGAIGIPSAGE